MSCYAFTFGPIALTKSPFLVWQDTLLLEWKHYGLRGKGENSLIATKWVFYALKEELRTLY